MAEAAPTPADAGEPAAAPAPAGAATQSIATIGLLVSGLALALAAFTLVAYVRRRPAG
jgi:hypothetical protein